MADAEYPSRSVLASLRAGAPARDARSGADLPPILEHLLDTLTDLPEAAFEPARETLRLRLGDARTVALLEAGDAERVGALLREALRMSGAAVRRAAAEEPDNPRRRMDLVRAAGPLRLGQLLLVQGVVAPRRLESALEAQKATQRRIGAELVAAGHLQARDVAEALWLQHKLVSVALALIVQIAAANPLPAPRLVRAAP